MFLESLETMSAHKQILMSVDHGHKAIASVAYK